MDAFVAESATVAELIAALAATYSDALESYLRWRRASATRNTTYRRNGGGGGGQVGTGETPGLGAATDRIEAEAASTLGALGAPSFCAAGISLAGAGGRITQAYDGAHARLGDDFARGDEATQTALRDQILTLAHGLASLHAASIEPASRSGGALVELSSVLSCSESVCRDALRALARLCHRLGGPRPTPVSGSAAQSPAADRAGEGHNRGHTPGLILETALSSPLSASPLSPASSSSAVASSLSALSMPSPSAASSLSPLSISSLLSATSSFSPLAASSLWPVSIPSLASPASPALLSPSSTLSSSSPSSSIRPNPAPAHLPSSPLAPTHRSRRLGSRPDNSVFSIFCPEAVALQDDPSRPLSGEPSCAVCGYRWHGAMPASRAAPDEGFRPTARFLAKSHCAAAGAALEAEEGGGSGGGVYGCVLCTPSGITGQYAGVAALEAHISQAHSKWQMIHDGDLS